MQYAYGYESTSDKTRFLVLSEKDNFQAVPAAELSMFGTPKFVHMLNFERGRPLGMNADEMQKLESVGYAFIGKLVVRSVETDARPR